MEGSSTVQEAGTEGSSTVLDLLHQQLEEVTELEKSRNSQGQVSKQQSLPFLLSPKPDSTPYVSVNCS